MGWDGNGNFTREHDWTDDANSDIDIEASRMDTEDDNFATGINACLTKNGENSATLLTVDNIQINGNQISSINTDGNINLVPDGDGFVQIDGVSIQSEGVTLTGSFTSGTFRVSRAGNLVTICATSVASPAHSSAVSCSSGADVPTWARPQVTIYNIYYIDGNGVNRITVTDDGIINTAYFDWAGSTVARNGSGYFTISYSVS